MSFEELLQISPYSLRQQEKERVLGIRLSELTEHHRLQCTQYDMILNSIGYDLDNAITYLDLPFLPVQLFKLLELKSIPECDIVKTLTSSGTTGQAVSKIYLDRVTAANQQKALVKIVNDFTGSERMPMIIIDCPSVIKDRRLFSARGAGILGFSVFGRERIYALDDDMRLNTELIQEFLEKHRDKKILLFGFTFMIWQYFCTELLRLKSSGISFDLSKGILIHGGGWKKLQDEAISRERFHKLLKKACGLTRIHDYYGMVEQTGCIYMECEHGYFHTSVFSDIVCRRPMDFSECNIGEPGIIQVLSAIPESYPGHSLLTEDEGTIIGIDDCACGRRGKYFRINGRLKNSEIRGCSDTYATSFNG